MDRRGQMHRRIDGSCSESPRQSRWKHWVTPAMILLMAAAIVVLTTGNWTRWMGERASQETDDAT